MNNIRCFALLPSSHVLMASRFYLIFFIHRQFRFRFYMHYVEVHVVCNFSLFLLISSCIPVKLTFFSIPILTHSPILCCLLAFTYWRFIFVLLSASLFFPNSICYLSFINLRIPPVIHFFFKIPFRNYKHKHKNIRDLIRWEIDMKRLSILIFLISKS